MGSSSKEDTASDGDTSSRETPPPDSSLFSEGERVLAYHGPRVYEAKVQKAEVRKKEWRFYVHYLGWNKNWDEWVGADRLLKYTEENLMKQQALQKKQGVDKSSKSGRPGHSKQKGSTDAKVDKDDLKSNVAKGKKRKSDSSIEVWENLGKIAHEHMDAPFGKLNKDNLSLERLIKIQIPPTLKKQLVDDWEFVTQQDQLVKLPHSPNVDQILTKYIQYRTKKENLLVGTVIEIMRGIRLYFDKALPAMLLYKKEREQYHHVIVNNVSPSTIYGAEHLLRLFVKLPELLLYVDIEDETLTRMQQKLTDFLKWLQKNQSTYFLSRYDG